MKEKKVTIQNIADKLNVSKGLVSLALSGVYGVNEERREEILITAIQMGYDFDRLKRRKQNKNKKIFYVITKDIDLNTDRYWPQILKGINAKMLELGYLVRVKSWDSNTDVRSFIADVLDSLVSGIIVLNDLPVELYENLILSQIPAVIVDSKGNVGGIMDSVAANNYTDFYESTKYGISCGHTKCAFVGDPNVSLSFNQRLNGFRDCIYSSFGENTAEYLLKPGVDEDCFDRAQVEESLVRGERTLYMCANDYISKAVYEIAREHGIHIPQDISVIGFDDDIGSATMKPPLTTRKVSKNEIGSSAVELLTWRLDNISAPCRNVGISSKLIERESVKRGSHLFVLTSARKEK